MYLTINKTNVFYKTTTNTDKENLTFTVIDFENIATQLTDALYDHQIQSVIIEGGRQTLQTFIDANLWMKHAFLEELYTKRRHCSPNYGFSLNKIQSVKMNL
jgi:hypothetical protein